MHVCEYVHVYTCVYTCVHITVKCRYTIGVTPEMYAQLVAKEIDIALLNVERMRPDDVIHLTHSHNLLTVPALLATTAIIQGMRTSALYTVLDRRDVLCM